jgi:outer membrane lipoprotein SlyB
MKLKKVTDPALLAELNESLPKNVKKVTDPALLAELNEEPQEQGFFRKLLPNIHAGLLEGARGIGNIPHLLHLPNAPYFEPTDFSKMTGITGPETLSDKLIQGLAQFAPSIAAPEAQLGRVGETIEKIPKFGRFLKSATSIAVPQAAYGAIQNESPLQGALEGGLGSLGGSALGALIGKSINSLRPTKIYKSPLNKEELLKASKISEDITSDLGNIIENPQLQRFFENRLPKYTGDTSLVMQNTGRQIIGKGEKILSDLLGENSKASVPEQLTKYLTDAFSSHQKLKNSLYEKVDNLAAKEDLKLNLSNFRDIGNKYITAIEDSHFLKHEPEAKNIFHKLIKFKNAQTPIKNIGLVVDKYGKPIINETNQKQPTLKEANILKGILSRYGQSFAQSSAPADRNLATIFRNLSGSLKKDIHNSINSSKNPTLIKEYEEAEKNYQKNFSPFLDKDIYKFISGNADPQTIISKFLVNSNINDLSGKLTKLSSKLSMPGQKHIMSNGQKLLGYGYLSRAIDKEGNLNPNKLSNLIKKLGLKQFETLFPDKKLRDELSNFTNLVSKNPRALQVMFNPLTGQVNSDIAPHTLAGVIGGLTGLVSGGTAGSVIGTAAGPIIMKKLANFATKKLTDPAYRKKFIDALIENKEFEISKKASSGFSKTGSLIAQGIGNKPMELEVIGNRRK